VYIIVALPDNIQFLSHT